MDLLSEYEKHMTESYIEAKLRGHSIWIKTDENGDMVVFSPDMKIPCRYELMTIQVPEMNTTLNVAGLITSIQSDLYLIKVDSFKEGDANGKCL